MNEEIDIPESTERQKAYCKLIKDVESIAKMFYVTPKEFVNVFLGAYYGSSKK